jgi:uracil-DNA glycosylase
MPEYPLIEAAYARMLATLADKPEVLTPYEKLVAHYPMKGKAEKVDTMFIGRALNGWHQHFTPEELRDDLAKVLRGIIEDGHGADDYVDRLAWIDRMWGNRKEGYNTAKSQFLQVMKRVAETRKSKECNWWDEIVWTNLLKVAPPGQNPPMAMTRVNGEASLSLIHAEIATFRPRNIVCLSGMVWAKNLLESGANVSRIEHEAEYLEFAGDVSFGDLPPVRFIVMPHPQTRSSKRMAAEIIHALNASK